MVSFSFITGFVGISIVFLIGMLLFSEVSEVKIQQEEIDVNCKVNYDHWKGCEGKRVTFDGEKGHDYSAALFTLVIIPALIAPLLIIRRLF